MDLSREHEPARSSRWERKSFLVHTVLPLLAGAWLALILAMYAHVRSRLGKDSLEGPGSGVIYGVSLFLSVALLVLQTVSSMNLWLPPRWRWRCRGIDPVSTEWCLVAYKVATAQFIAQTICAFLALTNFLFNALGLSVSACLAQRHCTTGLQDASGPRQALSWKQAFKEMSLAQPYTNVTGTIDMTSGHIKLPPVKWGSSSADQSPFVGILVDLAVPLEVHFHEHDVLFLVLVCCVYCFTVMCLLLYLVLFRTSGMDITFLNRLQTYIGLHGLEVMSGIGVLGILSCTTYCFARFLDATFGYAWFLGAASLFLLTRLRMARLRNQQQGFFTTWQQRHATERAATLMAAVTYSAGLTLSFFICAVADIWPEKLHIPPTVTLFILGILLHVSLTIGYAYSIHAHLVLAKYRDAEAHMSFNSAESQEIRQANPALAVAGGGGAESECTICMDAEKSAVLRPCGHYLMCYECAQAIMNGRGAVCPVCRSRIDDVLRVYNA